MLLTRNSGCKDKGFVLIDKDLRFFFLHYRGVWRFYASSEAYGRNIKKQAGLHSGILSRIPE